MKLTNTNIKVAKKYQGMLQEIDFEGRDSGYWAYSKKGFRFAGMGCHTAHEDNQKDLKDMIRTLEPCDCEECVVQETPEKKSLDPREEHLVGSEIYVGDFENMAVVTSAEIYPEPIFTELGDGSAGKIFIKYPDRDQPEQHDIHIHVGEIMEEEAYICTRNIDYTGGEHEEEFECVFMSEMLS